MPLRAAMTAVVLLSATAAAQTAGQRVTAARYAHLARGVNLTRWFAYGGPEPIGPRDRDLLRDAGFTSVRVAVAPRYLLPKWAGPEKLAKTLADLDRGLDLFLDSGMAVMLDFQADDEYRDYYLANPGAPDELIRTWRMLAARYADRNPDLLFFEIMNEPDARFTRAAWDAEESRVLAAIREVAPHHTVLLAPVNWSGIDALVQTTPAQDSNVIYVLHYYQPTAFTHQGATWSNPALAPLRNVPWPAFLARREASPLVRDYIDEDRDAASIDWDMSMAAEWSRRWNAPVVVNEFGAYKPFSPPDSRARWLRDVRSAAERHGLGWCMWDYGGGFDLITERGQIDPDVSAALGLTAWVRPDPTRPERAPFSNPRIVQMGPSPESGGYPEAIIPADINGDGLPDLLLAPVTWPFPEVNQIQVFLNQGRGIFSLASFDGPAPAGRFVAQIVAGRFDRSGRPGFFFAERGPDDGSGGQSRLALPSGGTLRDATGNVPQKTVRTTGAAAADVDGDGVDDLVVFDPAPELWRNDGTGHFTIDPAAFPYDPATFTCGVFIGNDLAAFGAAEGRLYINDGRSGFRAGASIAVPPANGGPAIGGCAVVADGRVAVAFRNDVVEMVDPARPGQTETITLDRSELGLRRLAVAGRDLVLTRPGDAPVILRDGRPVQAHLTKGLPAVAPADIDGDGKIDLIFPQGPGRPILARFGQ